MFNAEDIFDENIDKFTDKAVKALNTVKATGVIHQYAEYTGTWKKIEDNPLKAAIATIHPESSFDPQARLIRTIGRLLDIEPDFIRRIAQVRYFGVKVTDKSKREASIKKLASIVNDFAEKDFVMGHLAKLMEIKLGSLPNQPENDDTIIISYVILTDNGVKYLESKKENSYEIAEGQMPKSLED